MTYDPELGALIGALHDQAVQLGESHRTVADRLEELADHLDDVAAHLNTAPPDPDPDPVDPEPDPVDPEPEPVVELASVGRQLIRQLDTAPDVDMTGQQLGDLFASRHHQVSRPQGQHPSGWATIVTRPGRMWDVTMSRAGRPTYGATTLQQHFQQLGTQTDSGYPALIGEFDLIIPDVPFRTLKTWGPVAFDGDWSRWPGGNLDPGPNNYSCRIIVNEWAPTPPGAEFRPHLSLYMYHGTTNPLVNARAGTGPWTPIGSTQQGTHGDVSIWRKDNGHTTEVVATGGPDLIPGQKYRVRLETTRTNRGHQVARLLIIPPGEVGWRHALSVDVAVTTGTQPYSRSYLALMFGGVDESFAPRNHNQTATVGFGALDVWDADPDEIRRLVIQGGNQT